MHRCPGFEVDIIPGFLWNVSVDLCHGPKFLSLNNRMSCFTGGRDTETEWLLDKPMGSD